MVLDVESFRPQADPAALGPAGVKEIQRRRYKDAGVVDAIQHIDAQWRRANFIAEKLSQVKNVCSKAVGDKMKAKQPPGAADEAVPPALLAQLHEPESIGPQQLAALTVSQLKKLAADIDAVRNDYTSKATAYDEQRMALVRTVGNVVHDSVPVSDNEDNNAIVRTVGDAAVTKSRKKYSHIDLIAMIGGVDTARGTVVAGNRCYYLKGAAVCLETALVAFAQQFLLDRGYTPLSPPVFMRKEIMQEVAQLSQFDEELYKVTGKASEVATEAGVEEKYLIATAEQPIAAFHRDEWMDPASLPLRYVGVSECFRQEVGSHGRDTLGIFRVHQFKKIEQFCITSPHDEQSWREMEQMLANAEGFLCALGLPYQVVTIVSGALNLAASKKNDIEGWFPGSGAFRELVSCSNCTDYQSRRLRIRYGLSKKLGGKAEFVHMLNSTLCATTRNICCILENFQVGDLESKGGIVVPEVLQPYMPSQYKQFIPFVKPAPIDEEVAKAAAAAAAPAGAAKEAGKKK